MKTNYRVLLFVAVSLGMIATPAIGQGLWSNGDTNGSNASIGWVNVRQFTSAQVTPALAASNEVHLVDVAVGGVLVRDFAWSRTDGWKAPVFLAVPGGPASGAGPGLASRSGGILDLVVRGKDQYYHAYLAPGSGWSAWEPIGGWGGDPAVTTTIVAGGAVVDVWVQAKGSIWRRRWKSPSWQAWEQIGQPPGKMLVTSPGVVVRPGGTIDIVAGAAGDGQLYHTFFSPEGKFFGWESIPGKTFSKPALTSPAANQLDLWVRGASDKRLYHSAATQSGWSGFEMSVNTAPSAGLLGTLFESGVTAVLSEGVVTIASVGIDNKLLVRSLVDSVPAGVTAQPTAKITNTLVTSSAENSVVVVPPSAGATAQPIAKITNTLITNSAEYQDGSVIYSLGATSELARVSYACAVSGVGLQPPGPLGVCPATLVSSIIPGTGSIDSQIVRLNDGKLVWLSQNGTVSTPTVLGCMGFPVTRGTESVRASADSGKTWPLIATLDPCVGAPFNTSVTCNTTSVPDKSVPANACGRDPTAINWSGTDRPELFASTFDDSIYIALGVAGTNVYNLHILKSQGSSLGTWQDLDTGLGSGGAVAMAETSTYLYFARAEYGSPSNVGLYRRPKDAALTKSNFEFVGNLADQEASGNVQLSLLTDASGGLIFRWACLTNQGRIRRGFSKLTPGGVVTLASDLYQPTPPATVALPTFVSSPTTSKRAFLYWYEGTSTGTYSVKGAMSDGVGRWSDPVMLGGPWRSSATFTQMGLPGNDYLKGVYLSGQDTFLATWLQPDRGETRLGQAAVK